MDDNKRTPSKDLPYDHRRILSLLKRGKNNTVTVRELIQITGYKDQFIRKCVSQLVNDHHWPVGTSNEAGHCGYYLMMNEDERRATYRNLVSRGRQNFKRAKVVKWVELVGGDDDWLDDVF